MNLPVHASDHVDWMTAVWPASDSRSGGASSIAATGPFGSATAIGTSSSGVITMKFGTGSSSRHSPIALMSTSFDTRLRRVAAISAATMPPNE